MERISTILETIGFGEKIGRFLQVLAKVLFCLSVIGAVGACIIMIIIDDDLIGLALGILFGAPISAYLGGLPIYAIGLVAEKCISGEITSHAATPSYFVQNSIPSVVPSSTSHTSSSESSAPSAGSDKPNFSASFESSTAQQVDDLPHLL